MNTARASVAFIPKYLIEELERLEQPTMNV